MIGPLRRGLRYAATLMNSSTSYRHHRDVWRQLFSVGSRNGRCETPLAPWLLIQMKHPTFGFVTCVTCCVHRNTLSTRSVVPVAPPCFDASDAMEEDWLDDQLQQSLGIDHAEATRTVEPTSEPKLLIGRFGCISGDHTVPHAEHISLLRAEQHATRFLKDDGSVLCFVSDCQLVVDLWKRRRQYCCGAQHWFADIWRMLDKKFSVAGTEGGGSTVAG